MKNGAMTAMQLAKGKGGVSGGNGMGKSCGVAAFDEVAQGDNLSFATMARMFADNGQPMYPMRVPVEAIQQMQGPFVYHMQNPQGGGHIEAAETPQELMQVAQSQGAPEMYIMSPQPVQEFQITEEEAGQVAGSGWFSQTFTRPWKKHVWRPKNKAIAKQAAPVVAGMVGGYFGGPVGGAAAGAAVGSLKGIRKGNEGTGGTAWQGALSGAGKGMVGAGLTNVLTGSYTGSLGSKLGQMGGRFSQGMDVTRGFSGGSLSSNPLGATPTGQYGPMASGYKGAGGLGQTASSVKAGGGMLGGMSGMQKAGLGLAALSMGSRMMSKPQYVQPAELPAYPDAKNITGEAYGQNILEQGVPPQQMAAIDAKYDKMKKDRMQQMEQYYNQYNVRIQPHEMNRAMQEIDDMKAQEMANLDLQLRSDAYNKQVTYDLKRIEAMYGPAAAQQAADQINAGIAAGEREGMYGSMGDLATAMVKAG